MVKTVDILLKIEITDQEDCFQFTSKREFAEKVIDRLMLNDLGEYSAYLLDTRGRKISEL